MTAERSRPINEPKGVQPSIFAILESYKKGVKEWVNY